MIDIRPNSNFDSNFLIFDKFYHHFFNLAYFISNFKRNLQILSSIIYLLISIKVKNKIFQKDKKLGVKFFKKFKNLRVKFTKIKIKINLE